MENSYDRRIVDYESVHQLTKSDFELFVAVIAPVSGESILDVGSGYGAATREMILKNRDIPINYVLLEKSKVQHDRARIELGKIAISDFLEKHITFVNDSVQNCPFDNGSFDKVVAKSFIHEIPKEEKVSSFRNIYNILKKNGRFVIWNYVLDEINCDYVRKMILKKDELARYDGLVKDRHFPTEKELKNSLQMAGFKNIQEKHNFRYTHHSLFRLGEFNNDPVLLEAFNNYLIELAEQLDDETKEHLEIKIQDNDITLVIKQCIYTAEK